MNKVCKGYQFEISKEVWIANQAIYSLEAKCEGKFLCFQTLQSELELELLNKKS